LELLTSIGLLITGLSILVTIHELGHYLPAKWFGMRVDKFYLFFDWPRKLFSIKRNDTEYGIGLLPVGGYVKIAGMIDESLDTAQLASEPQPWEFRAKPVWQRFIVMVGGVTMNILLGVLIFWMLAYSTPDYHIPVDSLQNGLFVAPGSLAADLGLEPRDRIIAVNGQPIQYLHEAGRSEIFLTDNSSYTVLRCGQRVEIPVPDDFINTLSGMSRSQKGRLFEPNTLTVLMPRLPEDTSRYDSSVASVRAGLRDGDHILQVDTIPVQDFTDLPYAFSQYISRTVPLTVLRGSDTLRLSVTVDSTGKIGLAPNFYEIRRDTIHHGFFASFVVGMTRAWGIVTDNIKGFGKIFSGQADVSKTVSGPVAMAGMFKRFDFWTLVAMLSMVLAFVNILPIPALDGGHIIFLLIEWVRGKPAPQKLMLRIQQAGMFLILGLMAFVLFNDIRREVVDEPAPPARVEEVHTC
jgi:regulator of sigma E protease